MSSMCAVIVIPNLNFYLKRPKESKCKMSLVGNGIVIKNSTVYCSKICRVLSEGFIKRIYS